MFYKKVVVNLLTFHALFLLSACGAQSNPFRYLISSSDEDSFEFIFEKARADFDAGRLESALTLSAQALRLNKRSEKAAVLFGFVNLALAGADPFQLAKSLIKSDSDSSSDKGSGGVGMGRGRVPFNGFFEAGGGDPLASLKEAIGLTDEEIFELADVDRDVPDLPLLVPKCVETIRQQSQRLQYLDHAVLAICPFVDEGARVSQDYRQGCEPTVLKRKKSDEAHFLWSFAHLTEALVFNAVLTYRGDKPASSPTNLELRVQRIKEADQSDVSRFVEAVEGIQKMTDKILPTDGQCAPQTPTSQLRATLTDLMAVERGFSKLPNIPQKIVEPLKKGISGVVQAGANASALRGGFTKKLSQDLSAKVDQLAAAKTLSQEDRGKLCQQIAAISVGNQIVPSTCK